MTELLASSRANISQAKVLVNVKCSRNKSSLTLSSFAFKPRSWRQRAGEVIFGFHGSLVDRVAMRHGPTAADRPCDPRLILSGYLLRQDRVVWWRSMGSRLSTQY